MLNLKKDEVLNLSKEVLDLTKGSSLKKFYMGLGWDPVKSGWFGGGGSIDLDASCLVYDGSNNLIDTIWFRKLKSDDRAVIHSGDNLTGDGDGDDEVITVDLEKLSSNAKTLVFVVTSYRGQTFDKVAKAQCRLVDYHSNKEVVKYVLTEKESTTGQIMTKVYKENGEWLIKAIGQGVNGTIQSQLYSAIDNIL